MLPLTFCLASSEARSPSLSFFPSRDSSGVEAVEKEPNTSSIHTEILVRTSLQWKENHFSTLGHWYNLNALLTLQWKDRKVSDMVCGYSTSGRLCSTIHTSSTTFPPLIYNLKIPKYCTNSSPNMPCVLTYLPLPSHVCLAHIYLSSSAKMLISSVSSI